MRQSIGAQSAGFDKIRALRHLFVQGIHERTAFFSKWARDDALATFRDSFALCSTYERDDADFWLGTGSSASDLSDIKRKQSRSSDVQSSKKVPLHKATV